MADNKNQKWTINLCFEIEAPSQQAAEQEANRLGTKVSEQYNLDELTHTVGTATSTSMNKEKEFAASGAGSQQGSQGSQQSGSQSGSQQSSSKNS